MAAQPKQTIQTNDIREIYIFLDYNEVEIFARSLSWVTLFG